LRNLGPLSSPDAGAAGDLATAESLPDRRERARTSRDGRWWWNGRRWLATTTEDGLWRWDGTRWRPTIDLAGTRPRDLTATLTLLAEDRFAQAALILIERASEWRSAGWARQLLDQAARLRHRLLPTQVEHRALLVRLGRAAPCPTVKEADELLEVARRLDAWSAALGAALADVDRGELDRVRAIAAAQRALEEAEERRRAALAAGRRALEEARGLRDERRREARDRLRQALAPPFGQALAQVGALRACATAVETPAGWLPVAGLGVEVGGAAALWAERRDLLQDLLLLGAPEGDAFFQALTERRDDRFVLLEGRSRTVLWPCPAGQEAAAEAFAEAVRGLASGPAAPEVAADATPVAALPDERRAWRALKRLEADRDLLEPIAAARERLSRSREDSPDLLAARRRLTEAVELVTTPPAPLS
jgi:hypothetical protein